MSFAFATLMLLQQAAPAAVPATPPPACESEAHAQFDFWVGEWDVFPRGSDQLVAHSKIEKLYAGCAIRENWMPIGGTGGGSLNGVDSASGRWLQRWIGSSGEVVDFEGGLTETGTMVLTGYWPNYAGDGRAALVRMEYSSAEGGAVRQLGLTSYDHGQTWTTGFDFVYRQRAG